ncbi:MAG: hypothetical protein WHU94_01640 [Thermogemmata sp.]
MKHSAHCQSRRSLRGARSLVLLAVGCGLAAGCADWLALPSRTPPITQPLIRSVGQGDELGMPAPAPTLPGRFATRRGNYVFYHDVPWPSSDTLLNDVETLPDELREALELPLGQTCLIQVFLFESQERYERYIKARYPHLPTRRAYFLQEPRPGGRDDLKVLTWMGEHLYTDLRHELTHAWLHSVLKEVPLWLDEGLASCFEWPASQRGIHPQHLEHLRRQGVHSDLSRLERLERVEEMEKPEYREAWAWTHFLLYGPPPARQVLREYMQHLRNTSRPGPLWPRLQQHFADPQAALQLHVESLEWPVRWGSRPVTSAPPPAP